MADTSHLLTRSAGELAGLIRDGQISSRELTEAALERIDAVNPSVNAFTALDADRALETAGAIGADDPRPFAGVPIAIKDLFTPIAGFRQTNCSALLADGAIAEYDHNVVARVRAAGFVIVGVTNSPEFGILPVTEPRLNGPTRNPWNLDRTSGGSSGGAGAAVAAGLVPLAHGSDGGGSIRIPAACCGLFGLKPSRGRISLAPALGDNFLVTDGALTRTVADSAAMLDLLAGYVTGDATWAQPPDEAFSAAAGREPGRLRVGLLTDSPIGSAIDPVCTQAAVDAAKLLESLGHEIVEARSLQMPELLPTFTVVWAATVAGSVVLSAMLAGREPTEADLEPLSWTLYQQGLQCNAVQLMGATVALQAAARQIVAQFDDFDVMLTPALGQRPVAIGQINACSDDPMADFAASAEFTPFTALWNVTGQPAMSVPLAHGEDGLPLAVQIVGRPVAETTLYSLAAQLEAAQPWADRLAPLAAQPATA
ncbi:MAG TPA: amidase [Solirubrobacteraceae bacterium]|nr:amidase [Solirubrobacteraceae bacterium]